MIVGATALIVAPLTAVATHTFNDVPDSHTFHNDITWLADAGVTKGCNPPDNTEFCPNDNVTRGQMAAFIRRLAEGEVVDAGTLEGFDATELAPIAVVGETGAQTFTDPGNDDFSDIPGASAEITVPSGAPSLVVARFTAESTCVSAIDNGWASVRLVIDGNEMSPAVGSDFAFDSAEADATHPSGDGAWESHSVERFEVNVPAGAHTVTAQWASENCDSFRLDDWTLVAEARLGGTASLAALGVNNSQG